MRDTEAGAALTALPAEEAEAFLARAGFLRGAVARALLLEPEEPEFTRPVAAALLAVVVAVIGGTYYLAVAAIASPAWAVSAWPTWLRHLATVASVVLWFPAQVVLHEGGHVLVGRCVGQRVWRLQFWRLHGWVDDDSGEWAWRWGRQYDDPDYAGIHAGVWLTEPPPSIGHAGEVVTALGGTFAQAAFGAGALALLASAPTWLVGSPPLTCAVVGAGVWGGISVVNLIPAGPADGMRALLHWIAAKEC